MANNDEYDDPKNYPKKWKRPDPDPLPPDQAATHVSVMVARLHTTTGEERSQLLAQLRNRTTPNFRKKVVTKLIVKLRKAKTDKIREGLVSTLIEIGPAILTRACESVKPPCTVIQASGTILAISMGVRSMSLIELAIAHAQLRWAYLRLDPHDTVWRRAAEDLGVKIAQRIRRPTP